MRSSFCAAVVCGVVVVHSGCFLSDEVCADIPAERLAELPQKLSASGLFSDIDDETLAPGVRAYAPQFPLFTDGAAKRRWVALPDGAAIGVADVDDWEFPVGTTFWKEFTRDDVRVETRLLTRVASSDDVNADWVAAAYLWDADGRDATLLPEGKDDARGTPHDVPAAATCMGCHGGTRSRVLGFSAVQLGYDAAPDLVDLQDLVDEGRVDAPVAVRAVPGDDVDRAALGYLHANCSHCHNQERPAGVFGHRCYDPWQGFDLTLRHGDLGAVADTATFRSVVDEDGAGFGLGRGGDDAPIVKMMEAGFMPRLGTEEVDDDGVDAVRRFFAKF